MDLIGRKEAKALGLKTYFTGKPCPKSHVSERVVASAGCAQCGRELSLARSRNSEEKEKRAERKKSPAYKEQQAEYSRRPETLAAARVIASRPENRAKQAEYRSANAESQKEYMRSYYLDNREKLISQNKEYNKRPEVAERRARYIKEWQREFRRTTEGRAVNAMRAMIYRCVINKRDRTSDLIGYTRAELISHMEALFLPGMTWQNHGEWHIDHIKPVSMFIRIGVTEPKIINALSNLQPLWAYDNLSKGSTRA